MFDFWVVTGRICLDKEFYADLFNRAQRGEEFIELKDLRRAFREGRFRLSRWEVMELHRLITTKEVIPPPKLGEKATKKAFAKAEDNEFVNNIRKAAMPVLGGVPGNPELLAVIGLCCVDDIFRDRLHAASREDPKDTAALSDFIVHDEESPGFDLKPDEFEALNRLIRAPGMKEALAEFQANDWVIKKVHKHFGACTPGHSGKRYKHLAAQEVAQILDMQEREKEKADALKQNLIDARAIV